MYSLQRILVRLAKHQNSVIREFPNEKEKGAVALRVMDTRYRMPDYLTSCILCRIS